MSPVDQPHSAVPIPLRINKAFALLVVIVLPCLVGLGFWQLVRAEEKAVALASVESRRALAPVSIAEIGASVAPAELDRRQVHLHGHYLDQHNFLLDNRIYRGKVGYELLTPFADSHGITVMVNRGFLEGARTRSELPMITPIGAELDLRGEIYVPPDLSAVQMYATDSWPRVVEAVDTAGMAAMIDRQVFPYLVLLDQGQAGVTEAQWPPVNILPERHVAYAVQWFMIAAALVLVFVFGGTNLQQWARQRTGERNDA